MSKTTTLTVISNEEAGLEERATSLIQQSGRVTIQTDDDYANAGTLIKLCREVKKKAEDERKALTQPLRDLTTDINDRFKARITGPLDKAVAAIQPQLNQYARKKEQERQEQIRREREEQERKALEAAEQAEATGSEELANKALSRAERKTLAERQGKSVTSQHGVSTSTREVWTGEVADLKAVLQAVIDGAIPEEAVTIGKKHLNDFAKKTGEEGVHRGVRITKDIRAVSR